MRQRVNRSVIGALSLICVVGAWQATPAGALPPERHYEMVSPPYKAGYGVGLIEAVAPDGESVVYDSLGSFAGAPANHIGAGFGSGYVAGRGGSDWITSPLVLPASVAPFSAPPIVDFSSRLDHVVFYGQVGANAGVSKYESSQAEFLVHPVNAFAGEGVFELAGEVLKAPTGKDTTLLPEGASANLSHVIVKSPEGITLTPEAAGATTMTSAVYDLRSQREGSPALRFIGLNNQTEPKPIDPNCQYVELGAVTEGLSGENASGQDSTFNALAEDGREIFFWTCAGSTTSKQLFVRLNDERTLEVSRPMGAGAFGGCVGEAAPHIAGEVPCEGASTRPPAEFVGAAANGSRVYFMTTAQLVGEDSDTSNDLYTATIGCPKSELDCAVSKREVTSVTRISTPVNLGEAGDARGAVVVSPDGSHVYFVAAGVLSGVNAQGAAPVRGADNLYVYDAASGSVTFISDVCSNAVHSGEVEDLSCPANLDGMNRNDERLWKLTEPAAQTTENGDFLAFLSYGQLSADDTDNARDVYLYNARSGGLVRVSVGEAGYSSNGNREDEAGQRNADAAIVDFPPVTLPRTYDQLMLGTRAISEDGSRIVFSTREPLSPNATNGLLNAYEWHEGSIALVSSGSDEQAVGQNQRIAITPSGSDIFFMTVQKLLSQDTDEALDIYDARTGPGFPRTPGPTEPCSGDACQGPLSMPAPALLPGGTATQAAGEEATLPPRGAQAKAQKARSRRTSKKRHRRKARRRRARSSKRIRSSKNTMSGRGGR